MAWLSSVGGEASSRPDLVDREVSCGPLGVWFAALEGSGYPAERLAEGTGFSARHLREPRERIPWDAYRRFLENAARIWSDHDLGQIGARLPHQPGPRPLLRAASLLSDVTDAYTWLFGPGGAALGLTSTEEIRLLSAGPGRLHVEVSMRASYAPSRENFVVVGGVLRGTAAAMGFRPPKVAMSIGERSACYDLTFPDVRRRLAKLWRTVGWPFREPIAGELVDASAEDEVAGGSRRVLDVLPIASVSVDAQGRVTHVNAEFRRRFGVSNTDLAGRDLLAALSGASADAVRRMEAVGAVAARVSHDLNNLLTVIHGCSETMGDAFPPGDRRAEDARIQQVAIRRAGELARQLLALARPAVAEPEAVELGDVVREHEGVLRRVVGDGPRLEVLAGAGDAWVRIDPARLAQVLTNLVANARDARARIVTVSVGRVTDEATSATISVSDDGSGMDEATRARLFEPWFTTKSPGRGTGIGLAIVAEVVQQYGGSVAVESQVGRGTTFRIALPRIPAPGPT